MLGRRQYVVAVLIGASFAMASLGGISVLNAAVSYDPGTHFSAPNTKPLTIAVTPERPVGASRVAIGDGRVAGRPVLSGAKARPRGPRARGAAAAAGTPAKTMHTSTPTVEEAVRSSSPAPGHRSPSASPTPTHSRASPPSDPAPAPADSPVVDPDTGPAATMPRPSTTTSSAPTQTTTDSSPTPPPAPVDIPDPASSVVDTVGQVLVPVVAPAQRVVGSFGLGPGAGQ